MAENTTNIIENNQNNQTSTNEVNIPEDIKLIVGEDAELAKRISELVSNKYMAKDIVGQNFVPTKKFAETLEKTKTLETELREAKMASMSAEEKAAMAAEESERRAKEIEEQKNDQLINVTKELNKVKYDNKLQKLGIEESYYSLFIEECLLFEPEKADRLLENTLKVIYAVEQKVRKEMQAEFASKAPNFYQTTNDDGKKSYDKIISEAMNIK